MNAKFEYLLSTLTERESKVLTMIFLQHKSLVEVRKEFNIVGERIRQIEAKALRKLRHPARFNKVFFYVTDTVLESDALSDLTRASLYRLGITTEDNFLEAINSNILSDEVRAQMISALDEFRNGVNPIMKSIDYLGLSVCPYNCMRRARIDTCQQLIDIIEWDPDRLLEVRNLGRASLKEILDKINEKFPYVNTDRARELL